MTRMMRRGLVPVPVPVPVPTPLPVPVSGPVQVPRCWSITGTIGHTVGEEVGTVQEGAWEGRQQEKCGTATPPPPPPYPPPPPLHSTAGGALATVRARLPRCARHKLWGYLGPLPVIIAPIKRPPGRNKDYPQASGVYWEL